MLLALLAGTLALFPLSSYDTWWILAAGEHMLQTREILHSGIGSWTRSSTSYVYHGWMFAIFTALSYRILGEWGLILLRSLLAGSCFMFLGLATRARGARGAGVLLLPGLALLMGYTNLFWPVRAQSTSQVLLALTLLLMSLSRLEGWRRCLTLTLTTVVWANLHGGVLLGFVVLMIIVTGENIDCFRQGGGLERSKVMKDCALLAGAALGCLLTPYGVKGLFSALRHIRGEHVATLPLEWGTPRLADFPLFALLLGLVGIGLLTTIFSNRMRWADPLLFLLFAVMGLSSLRYLEIASIGLAFVGSSCFAAALGERYFKGWRGGIGAVASVILLGSLLGIGVGRDRYLFHGGWRPGRQLPVGAVDFMARNQIFQQVFNPYEWGGYLIWRLRPANVAFIDGRVDLYSEELVRDYLWVQDANPGWKIILDRYSIQAILWRNGQSGQALRTELEKDGSFVPIFKDQGAILFVRKNGRYLQLARSG